MSHDDGMSWSEMGGFVAGALSVLLYVRQSVWAWPVGIANSAFWLVLFWDTQLFLDAGLQVVYIGLGTLGWLWWARGRRVNGERLGELPVRRTGRSLALVLIGIGLVATAGLWWSMEQVGDAAPLPDSATTVVSLIAQYMLTRKLLGSWWCWIAVDVAYIVLYVNKELYLTAALQPLFIGLCVLGLRSWKADLAAVAVLSPAAVPA
jgi:nicotinamide mononucleotide transporter